MGRMRIMGSVVALLLLASLAVACGGDAGQDGGASGGGGGGVAAERSSLRAAEESAPRGAPAQFSAVADLPDVRANVIKTATLAIEVAEDGLQERIRRAVEIAGTYQGFVASSTLDSQGEQGGTLVIRVPSTSFERALTDLEDLGDVARESISGRDVTQEFVDLEARLRNWASQEAVLLRLMDRSRSVADTIRVQGELARVQLEIERLRGRLDYLEDQTALATITATFIGAGPAPGEPSTLARAWSRALGTALDVVAAIIVGAGAVIPVALLVTLALLLFRSLRPRLNP
jgi:hypothetical protein